MLSSLKTPADGMRPTSLYGDVTTFALFWSNPTSSQVTQPELSSLTCLLVWGDPKRFCSNVVFLLILPKVGITGERVYGLAMVWVHPYQARLSTIDDMAKKLILLASARPNWPYAFVWFNGDTITCLSQKKVTWVPWQRGCLATSCVEGYADWRSVNFCIQRPE